MARTMAMKNAGPEERDGDAAPGPGSALREVAHQKSADYGPDQADHDITADAVAAAFHGDAGQRAGDHADDDQRDDSPGNGA
jgi:hypothetical protein